MYFVDRSQIHNTLKHLDDLLKTCETISLETETEKLSLERITHIVIESIMDVGNMMIDGFIMRDPGSYTDIIDILIDEKVLPTEEEEAYKAIVNLRQSVVNNYLSIDHKNIHQKMTEHLNILQKFSSHIETYLKNELDVANAFSNEK